jgi:peroxiredoxin
MKTFLYALFISFLFWACSGQPENKLEAGFFKISGQVQGIADSTWMKLDHHNVIIDSCLVIDGKFVLTGGPLEHAQQMVVFTKDFHHYKFLWVEPTEISFKAEAGNFFDAEIKGSKLQDVDSQHFHTIRKTMQQLGKAAYEDPEVSEEERVILEGKMDSLYQLEQKLMLEFIENEPALVISGLYLEWQKAHLGKAKVEKLFNAFSDEVKKSSYGKSIEEYLSLNKDVQVGDQYADFSQEDTEGNMVSLSDFEGKVVLLEFWASWCGPCRKENPSVVKAYQQFKDKGFDILGVSLDGDKAKWMKAIQDDGLTWTHVSDLNGFKNKVAIIYGITGIPDNFLIDRNGKIVARGLRGDDLLKKVEEIIL